MLIKAIVLLEVDDKYKKFNWNDLFYASSESPISKAADGIKDEVCERLNQIDFERADNLNLPQEYLESVSVADSPFEDIVIGEW